MEESSRSSKIPRARLCGQEVLPRLDGMVSSRSSEKPRAHPPRQWVLHRRDGIDERSRSSEKRRGHPPRQEVLRRRDGIEERYRSSNGKPRAHPPRQQEVLMRAPTLPDELIAEILARVPYRSLCRFSCVSRSWRALCSDPAVRARCPPSLAGFFFRTTPLGPSPHARHFVNASGRGPPMADPSLSFLPPGHADAALVDSCNGRLLCVRQDVRSSDAGSRYFVCNPATEKWVDLPGIEARRETYWYGCPVIHLGFDPAVSSQFRVFLIVSAPDERLEWRDRVTGVEIYSSETGGWTYRQSEWGDGTVAGWNSVFFNGALHLTSPVSLSLLTVDTDGTAWGKIPTPRDFDFIGISQGRLHAVHVRNDHDNERLSIWVLEDCAGQQWNLKHTVSGMQMFGARPRSFGSSYSFQMHAIHPERSLIFLTAGRLRSLMSYDADERKVRFIWTLGESNTPTCYTPCFSDWS